MKIGKWTTAMAMALLLSSGSVALAQGQGKGKGKGHNKHSDDDQNVQFYKDRDREALRGWYGEHQSQLPPGLAKKDRLPPGPEELERRLPPPPPDCAHVLISGRLVLLNRRTNIIVDIFQFEGR